MLSNPRHPPASTYYTQRINVFTKISILQQILWFQSLSHQGLQDPVQFAEAKIGRALTRAVPGFYACFVSGIVDCAVVFACARKNAPNADLLLLKTYFLF